MKGRLPAGGSRDRSNVGVQVRPVRTGRGPRVRGYRVGAWSGGADVVRLRALLALAGFEGDPLALLQRLVPAAGDSGVVDEDVLAAVVGGNEAEALLAVEPLHGALRHISSFVPGPGGGIATSRSQGDQPGRGHRRPPPTHVVSCRARMIVDVVTLHSALGRQPGRCRGAGGS